MDTGLNAWCARHEIGVSTSGLIASQDARD